MNNHHCVMSTAATHVETAGEINPRGSQCPLRMVSGKLDWVEAPPWKEIGLSGDHVGLTSMQQPSAASTSCSSSKSQSFLQIVPDDWSSAASKYTHAVHLSFASWCWLARSLQTKRGALKQWVSSLGDVSWVAHSQGASPVPSGRYFTDVHLCVVGLLNGHLAMPGPHVLVVSAQVWKSIQTLNREKPLMAGWLIITSMEMSPNSGTPPVWLFSVWFSFNANTGFSKQGHAHIQGPLSQGPGFVCCASGHPPGRG